MPAARWRVSQGRPQDLHVKYWRCTTHEREHVSLEE